MPGARLASSWLEGLLTSCLSYSFCSQLIEEYRRNSNTVKELSGVLKDLCVRHEECVRESR